MAADHSSPDPMHKRLTYFNYAALVFFWAVLLAALHMSSPTPLDTGTLANNDDYSRMVRVFDLLDGKDHPSYWQPRIGPEGADLNWSRLVDWPLAAIEGVMEIFMYRYDAAMWTATIWPAALLFLFFIASYHLVLPFSGVQAALISVIACLLLWADLRQFIPGRIDHHMVQILLMLFAFGGLTRCYLTPEKLKNAVIAGLCFAIGLCIGVDVIPWLVLGSMLLGLLWLKNGAKYEMPAFIFGVAVFAGSIALHVLIPPYDRLLIPSCETISPIFIGMTGTVCAFFAALKYAPASLKNTLPKRAGLAALLGIALTAPLYYFVADCIHDPYQFENPELMRRIWLSHVHEAKSLLTYGSEEKEVAIAFAAPLFMGILGAFAGIWADRTRRDFWVAYSLILTAGSCLVLYQLRTIDIVQALTVLPISMGILWLWTAIQNMRAVATDIYEKIPYALRIGIIGVFLLAMGYQVALEAGKESTGTVQNARASTVAEEDDDENKCNAAYGALALDSVKEPLVIAAFVDDGPELLFWTNHQVLAAPYHRNEKGMVASYEIITADSADEARKVMKKYGANALMFCQPETDVWQQEKLESPDNSFVKDLHEGRIPDWLEPVKADNIGRYLIFKTVSE